VRFIVNAALWVWDFVVGDALIVAGVAVAVVIGLIIQASSSGSVRNAEGPLIFVAALAGMLLSLWQAARQSQ
jgi:type III secretory pathway component EscS